MEDIVILWSNESPESELWSEYLMTCFDKIMSQRARHHYRVTLITCEEILSEPKADVLEKISKAQLQIVIMCPRIVDKLDKLTDLKPLSPAQDGLFKPDKILIMLLGMERESVIATNEKAYPSIRQWPMKVVKEKDTTFVDSFLTAAVGILRTKDVKTTMEKTCFSIVPKKVKMNQSRVIALLNDPIREEDSIRITVDKKGEQIQIATHKKRNPYTIQFDIPDSCLDVSMLIWIKITKNGQSLGRRQIKCESRLRELDQILRANDHPIEFICQTLGFKTTDKDQLDSWMLASFQKNIPPHFNLLSSPEQYQTKPNASSPEEFPTLLHFAASYGLEKLCWQLLECPGGDAACNLRNARQLTPAELAHAAGFQQLAVILSGHMQMNEFSNMYYYLKNMTENDNITESTEKLMTNLRIVEDSDKQKDVIENNLITPSSEISTDHFSEECLQNLEKNVDLSNHGSKFQYKQVSSPTRKTPTHTYQREQLYENDIVFSSSPIQEEPPFDTVHRAMEHDYLIQPSNIKVECMPPKAVKPQTLYCNISNGNSNRGNQVFLYSPTEETNNFTLETRSESSSLHMTIKNRKNNSCSQSSRENGGLSGQDELAEIINDFKNNVFTISEVEKLVMEWRNRNETQQSLKEKQEQLAKMRDEYERLQQKIKENMKRPTPFDRVRKIFTKGKSKQNNTSGSIEKRNGNHRPNSSLSESSSSSGRLSTVSGGSIGESGTQSDIDEKRVSNNTLASTPTMDHDNIKLDDYLIPPPPRPLNGYPIPSSCPSRFDCPRMPMHMATIVERDNPHATVDNITFHNSREANNNFEANCRRNSLSEEQKRNNSHLYMNIGPS